MTLDEIVAKVADPYDRQARLYPALLCLLPVLALVAVLYAPNTSALTRVVTIAVSSGGLFLMTNICRDMGKRLEEKLYREWGGKPTTQLLRHRNGVLDSVTKRRYHAFLAAKIGTTFPDAEQEKNDPAKADEPYQSGARWLLDRTRPDDGKKFNLLFRDNVAYGFRRNALGVKPFGLALAVGSSLWVLIVDGVLFAPAHRFIDITAFSRMPEAATASLIVSTAMIFVWLFFVTKANARSAAFTYAETLLRTCDSL
jgi:hypothetical protein